MPKSITYIALSLLAAAIVVVGCKKQGPKPSTQGELVHLSGDVKAIVTPSSNVTKVTGASFDSGDAIGICSYLSTESVVGGDPESRFNVCYQKVVGLELVTSASPIRFNSDPLKLTHFTAYYPYSASVNAATGVLPIDLSNQNTPLNLSGSLLYSDNQRSLSPTANYINLEFRYIFSRIVVTVAFDPVTMPTAKFSDITAISLESVSLLSNTLDFNLDNAAITPTGGGPISLKLGTSDAAGSIIPGAMTGLNIKIAVPAFGYTYQATPTDRTYQAGYKYTYNITLKAPNVVVIGGVIIEPWLPGNGGGEDIDGDQE